MRGDGLARFSAFWLAPRGSTRSAALLRIGLALLLWTKFATDLAPFKAFTPDRLLLSAVFFTATTAMLVGFWSRTSTLLAGATALWLMFGIGVGQGHEPWVHHHVFLLALSTSLLAFTSCGGSYSLDRWLTIRAASARGEPPPPETGDLWGLRFIGLLVSNVYFWGAYDKTSWVFLGGYRLHHTFGYLFLGSDWPESPVTANVMAVLAVATVVIEYALAFGLWFRRLQPVGFAIGFVLHAIFFLALPVSTFSATILLLYLAYLDADAVHRVLDRLQSAGRKATESAE